jgi:2-keto-4-pentenoate hydratase/2-oxohepta-3-ene-1,7-dioic acid hydratase in catechol pathway
MRLVTFDDGRLGAIDGDEVLDLTAACGAEDAGIAGPLHAAINAGALPSDLQDPRLEGVPRHPVDGVTLQAPLPRPGKIVAAPVNYLAHRDEMRETRTVADLGVFLKAPTSVIGPGGTVELPYSDVRTDQEGELAVVIGARTRHVPPERALEHVFGYTCLLDMTVRSTEDRSTRKSFDTFTPLGPWVVTADDIEDPGALLLRCWVDGKLRQEASTETLIFGVPDLIAYASSVMTLEPGDVVATGTPAGVGPVCDGDAVTVEIERIGRLEVHVSAASARPYADRRRIAAA